MGAGGGVRLSRDGTAVWAWQGASGVCAVEADRKGGRVYPIFYIYLALRAADCVVTEMICRKQGLREPAIAR